MSRWDKILIITISALALAGLLLMYSGPMMQALSAGRAEVVVQVQGKEVLRVPLHSHVSGSRYYEISVPRGVATIEIKDGRVRVLRMPKEVCPLGICADTGWISNTTQSIVCMPNAMVVKIVSDVAPGTRLVDEGDGASRVEETAGPKTAGSETAGSDEPVDAVSY
ncbi:MAG TPA: NusG domain II-containing protein [Clostridia bacterium]|nr:NusG domain II-containing protein [Clostridia bacterium]